MALNVTSAECLEMFINYPFMQNLSVEQGWSYKGFIEVMGIDYQISMSCSDSEHVNIEIQPEISLENMSKEDKNPVVILNKIKSKIEQQSQNKAVINKTDVYRKVLIEYSELLRFHININNSNLSRDLSEIELSMFDEHKRLHTIKIIVKHDCGKLFFVKDVNLPFVNGEKCYANDNSLIAIFDKFCADVESPEMQAFLNFMEEIDRICWILDPINPNYQDTYRRINITENVSAVLTYNSLDFKSIPNIRFLGPKSEVAAFEDRLNSNFSDWDHNCDDPLQEFLIVIGVIDFLQKPKENDDSQHLLVDSGECCICFQSRLGNNLPEITCSNKSCSQVFHTNCLYQWLSQLNSRRVFYEISGECPFCKKTINCPIPNEIA